MGKNVHPTSAVKNLKKGKTKMANINILQMIEQCQVEWKTLGSVLVRTKGTKITAGKMKELHKNDGEIKIFAGGKTFAFVHKGDIPDNDINNQPSIIVKSRGIIEFEYYDKPFSHKNEMWSYYSNNDDINIKFIYHFLKQNEPHFQQIGSKMQMPQIATPDTDKFLIPIPPLPIQKEIVKILDKFTELEATLEAELSLREKQYTFYRDHLSTFGDDLEWKCLGEVVPLQRGKRLVKNQLLENAKYAVFQNSLQPLGYFSESNCRAYMTFIISAGAAGEIGFSNEEFWACDDCYYFDCPKESLNDKFLYYFLKLKQHKLLSQVRKASVPRLSRISIEKLKIPLPPLATQQKIVDILDKFETLTHSITEGLPKEIELRRKQYEYYREKLLTFPKQ
ncbi:restriction endonuclease subunit S [Pasteurella multocida]|nr:restriction endonuclease subunit S [Pasteurella multocida]MCL7776345.1 restriction endonuclease subunit S [Pasteurella multocida]MCW4599098.1 restriction endonuclease subunit S [Pasteurella multocida subsp. multocida]MDY0625273.1 restriction endonuclease subunit S [Pasteurella multocida]MDY0676732.1 restriction endonuclease subunit S [Pasteurella multocida]MDY0681154.1 restriction endonuclease subunit S [Pasteurella multocida]